MHNIARNMKSFHVRKANSHDAVCFSGVDAKGNEFQIWEPIKHPILVLHRDFEFPISQPRDESGNLITPTQGELDPVLYKRFKGTQRQYEQRGMVLNAPMRMKGRRTVMHHNRMPLHPVEGAIRSLGVHNPTPAQVEMYYAGEPMETILEQRS